MTYPIPAGVLEQIIAILGKTRSGKSSVARGLVEGLLKRHEPVCIIDPKGDWWGIKLAADGKGPGFPVVIFGGEHADVPLNERSGAVIAELVATGNRPCLIDLKGWMPGARSRFWIDFASTLFRLNRGNRWLMCDEFHNFAPKGRSLDPEDAKALHWSNRIASEGLGLGIHLIFASQRPQKVHNDVLTSAETLIAMKVIHPSDRDAIADWIKGCGDPKLGTDVLASLAQLQRGEGWVWSPDSSFGPTRIKFPLYSTYDSFKPQPVGGAKLKGWAEVDLEDVRARLAVVIKEAEAKDPTKLKAKIADLERQLKFLPKVEPMKDLKAIEDARAEGFAAGRAAERAHIIDKVTRPMTESLGALRGHAKRIGDLLGQDLGPVDYALLRQPRRAPVAQRIERRSPEPKAAGSSPAGRGNGTHLPGPQQRILDALAWWESVGVTSPSKVQIAVVARYSPEGGAFLNPLGTLRSAGLIDYPSPGAVTLTDEGHAHANPPGEAVTTEALHQKVMAILDGPKRRILEPLLKAYPSEMTREDLAAAAGYAPEGGAFANPLGNLRSLGLIDYPQSGLVVALSVLFVE